MQLKAKKTVDTAVDGIPKEEKLLDSLVQAQIGINTVLDTVFKEFYVLNNPILVFYREKKVRFWDKEIVLTPLQFSLFTILLENKNIACSVQDICESLDIENAESVLVLVSHLRKKIRQLGIAISTYWWESAYVLLDSEGMKEKVLYQGHTITFSLAHKTVQIDDEQPIEFLKGDFFLFRYLLKRSGHICSPEEILEKLSIKPSTLKVIISRIRKNISMYPFLHIQLHFNAGYSMLEDNKMKDMTQKPLEVLQFSPSYLYSQVLESPHYQNCPFANLDICESLYTISKVAFSKEEFSIFLILAIHYPMGISIEKMRNMYFKKEANRTTDIPLRELAIKLKILKILVEKKGDNLVLRF